MSHRILIDEASASAFVQVNSQTVGGEIRRYYAVRNPSIRAIMVCRDGLDLPHLAGCVVDANLGWDAGTHGYVLEGNEGEWHSKMTIYRVLGGTEHNIMLYEFLDLAPVAPTASNEGK